MITYFPIIFRLDARGTDVLEQHIVWEKDQMKPSMIMIAGPNGAGKTTAAMTLLPNFLHMREFVNADEIARGLSPLNASSVAIEAGRLMLKRLHTLIENQKDFAFETTAAGYGHIHTLKRCREAGYEIGLVFLYIATPVITIDRVKLRVSQGGHDVPQADIIRRYHKGIKNFFIHYAPLADKVEVYDNSYGDTRLVADNCIDKSWQIYQSEVWQNIQEKIYEQ